MTSAMCVALAIYFESASSNQPIDDQYSIGLVVVGRAHDYGWKPCDVVFEPKQFSSLNDALDDEGNLKPEYVPRGKAWRRSKKIAKEVLRGDMPDFTNGARFYYADYILPPAWTQGMLFTGKHGKHFYWRKKEKYPQPAEIADRHMGNRPTVVAQGS
jgi:spore germination cell wall hydrolase CwlJ-like protein